MSKNVNLAMLKKLGPSLNGKKKLMGLFLGREVSRFVSMENLENHGNLFWKSVKEVVTLTKQEKVFHIFNYKVK